MQNKESNRKNNRFRIDTYFDFRTNSNVRCCYGWSFVLFGINLYAFYTRCELYNHYLYSDGIRIWIKYRIYVRLNARHPHNVPRDNGAVMEVMLHVKFYQYAACHRRLVQVLVLVLVCLSVCMSKAKNQRVVCSVRWVVGAEQCEPSDPNNVSNRDVHRETTWDMDYVEWISEWILCTNFTNIWVDTPKCESKAEPSNVDWFRNPRTNGPHWTSHTSLSQAHTPNWNLLVSMHTQAILLCAYQLRLNVHATYNMFNLQELIAIIVLSALSASQRSSSSS